MKFIELNLDYLNYQPGGLYKLAIKNLTHLKQLQNTIPVFLIYKQKAF